MAASTSSGLAAWIAEQNGAEELSLEAASKWVEGVNETINSVLGDCVLQEGQRLKRKHQRSQVCWLTPLSPALERLRQED